MPWKQWAYLEKVSSTDFQNYLQNQAVSIFTSAAQRDTQIAAPIEGMCCYLTSTKTFQIYNGSAWEAAPQAPRIYQAQMGTGPTLASGALLTLATINIPAQPRAYNVEASCGWVGFGDVANDSFLLALKIGNTQVATAQNRWSNFNMHSNFGIGTSQLVPVAAGSPLVVVATIQRVSGTGICTQTSGTAPNFLTARAYV